MNEIQQLRPDVRAEVEKYLATVPRGNRFFFFMFKVLILDIIIIQSAKKRHQVFAKGIYFIFTFGFNLL